MSILEPSGNFLLQLQTLTEVLARSQESLGCDADPDDLEGEAYFLSRMIFNAHVEMQSALSDTSSDEYIQARNAYREALNPLLRQAAIVERCIDIPRGYHGDYLIMEMMYRNGYEGTSPLGRCIHHHVTMDRSCSSVRARRVHLRDRLAAVSRSGTRTIMSLACGSARELADALTCPGVTFRQIILLDQDAQALEFAEKLVRPLIPSGCELTILNLPVQRLLFQPDLRAFIGNPEYIYSAGLFDYLPTGFASRLVARLCEILPPHGCLEIGNFSDWKISFFADMASGWRLILRDEEAFSEIIPVMLRYNLSHVEDQLFASIYNESR